MADPESSPDPQPPLNRSMFEPSEERPSWALTPEQFTKLRCDFCGKPFEADGAGGVAGGLTVLDEEGELRYYHGYDFKQNNCFDRALKQMDG